FSQVAGRHGLGLFGRGGGKAAGAGGIVGGMATAAGAFSFGGKRAGGGPVSAGLAYLVGEKGPEIIVPRTPAVVIPNHAIGAGGVSRVVIELPPEFDGRIAKVSGPIAVEVVRKAAPAIRESTIQQLTRPELA
ncbi:MAG: hypothetical protein M3N07_03480, partial [Pseudomonadota bacterium]|nr:hypothetical protein [Pseudomonadota bacterium]